MSAKLKVVLGTRPEIIKLAPVVTAAQTRGIEVDIVHTNQHYADELDAKFFEELDLPQPAENLAVGSQSHGAQTGRMLERLESVLSGDYSHVVVLGDTNTALSGALVAAKKHRPVAHIEAGLRSFDRRMPEELNRRVIDHLADHLFPPSRLARDNLIREHVQGHVHPVLGNTIVDAVLQYAPRARLPLNERSRGILLTLHREENVDDPVTLEELLAGVDEVARTWQLEVIFPIHPRTMDRLARFGLSLPNTINMVLPQPFTELLRLQAECRLVMTDSGGLQEESCILGTPCVTLRTTTERPETIAIGANLLGGVRRQHIVAAANSMLERESCDWEHPFGPGTTGDRIVELLLASEPTAARVHAHAVS
jgi:UDP-N-acetylglucosamine 2-epimerase (non-hydrolysing)